MPETIKDINEAFDDIFLSVDREREIEFQQGFQEGSKTGETDGFHLGYHRGVEIGLELGYYKAVLEFHIQNSTIDKTINQLSKTQLLIAEFPLENSETIDTVASLNTIRAQFKKCCSLLKIENKFCNRDLSF